MDFFGEWEAQFILWLPIFIRLSAFWITAPMLGQHVPALAKIGVSGLLAVLVFPFIPLGEQPETLPALAMLVLTETITGLICGFVVNLVFAAIYLSGQLIDVPMGFGMANIFDPQTGVSIPLMSQFQRILAVLIFFTINGHQAFLRALVESFALVPIGGMQITGSVVETMVRIFASLFVLGLRIALPIMGAVLLTDVALGIMTRAVPQINVFIVGFPIKIAVGMFLYLFVLPVYVALISSVVGAGGEMLQMLRGIAAQMGGTP